MIFPIGHPAVMATAGQAQAPAAMPTAAPATATAPSPPAPPVDVQAVLTDRATKDGRDLNWRTCIVDLMKLVGLDSSLANRKAFAAELHYGGDTNDSANMNAWLYKQVMTKLAENCGKVHESLKD